MAKGGVIEVISPIFDRLKKDRKQFGVIFNLLRLKITLNCLKRPLVNLLPTISRWNPL